MKPSAQQSIIENDRAAGLDEIDRQIIIATQTGLPLVAQPYVAIAEQVGISAWEVMQRMQSMLDRGIIRRIAAVPNHYALGYRANGMSVWNIPDDQIMQLGEKIGSLSYVSHCYQRPRSLPDWPYNLFAMVHAHSREEAMQLVQQISQLLGEADRGHEVLFSSQILKKTGLRLNN